MVELEHDTVLQQTIEETLTRAIDAWNAGDLEGFMQAYCENEFVTLITPKSIIRGHADIADHYRPKIGGSMLQFELIEVLHVEHEIAYVIGKYMSGAESDEEEFGHFTLLMISEGDQWYIYRDQNS